MKLTTEPPPVEEFVRRWLPDPPGRVLEVGAGKGELAEAMRDAGYDVVAVDPQKDIWRGVIRLPLEAFESEEPFDAVVAIRSLHHFTDVRDATARMARHLDEDGVAIVQEFGWDLVTLTAADWMHDEMRRLHSGSTPRDPIGFYERWRHDHHRLAASDEMEAALAAVFEEVHREWIPCLADEYLEGDQLARRREVEGLKEGRLRPVAFRYVGRAV
jgi:ubiquinone/menaquinone biosynthesis C-methylase UbiE